MEDIEVKRNSSKDNQTNDPIHGAPGACFSKTLTVSWGPRTEILQDFHKDCVETSHEIEDTKL